MIALNETNEYAAEVPFFLPTIADPTTGLAGHVFTLGEVQVLLPGGTWTNVALAKIREVGFGQYAVRLTAAQTTVAGTVYVRAVVSGTQNAFSDEVIGVTGGDIPLTASGVVPFFLPNAADPIFGAPVTGHTFILGEVQIALPNAAFVNATLARIAEVGFGAYGYTLSAADTTLAGKAYLYANVIGAQKFLGWVTILGLGVGAGSPIPPGIPQPVAIINPPAQAASVDHVAAAVARMPQQFRNPLGF